MFVCVAPAALPMPSSWFLNHRSTETILFSHILKAGYPQCMYAQSIHVLMCAETTGGKKTTFNLLLQSQERPTFYFQWSVPTQHPCQGQLQTPSHIFQLTMNNHHPIIINSLLHIRVYHIKWLIPATDVSLISIKKTVFFTFWPWASDAAHKMNHLAFIHMQPGSVRIRGFDQSETWTGIFSFCPWGEWRTIQKGLHKSLETEASPVISWVAFLLCFTLSIPCFCSWIISVK